MKVKLSITLLCSLLYLTGSLSQLKAQVTIGDAVAPEDFSILEISSKNTKGGVRLPQLSTVQRNNLNLSGLTDPDQIIEAKGLTIYNTSTGVIEFWDGSTWVESKAVEPWRVNGTSTPASSNTQSIYQLGAVGIGTNNINSSAILDVTATNKGVLFPKVALKSNTDATTIPNPAKGLLIYNIGTGGLTTEGYLYWNGTEWQKFNSGTTIDPAIVALQCQNATMNPATFTAGVPYNGVMTIPYVGGNGGSYSGGNPIASTNNTGLTATLQSGTLKYGNGELVYTLSGTPKFSSPTTAQFAVNILGQSCTASVSGSVLGVGQMLTFIGTMPDNAGAGKLMSEYYPTSLPVMDGLRMDIAFATDELYRPRVFNVGSSTLNVSLQTFATVVNENRTLLNVSLTPGSYTQIDSNDIVYWTSAAAEVITTNLQVQISPNVWRWYEMKWWAMEITGTKQKTIFMSVTRKA